MITCVSACLLQRYIKSATPLVSEAELASTKKAMDEFVKGVGGKLHTDIVEREKKRYSSFITDAWFDMYLTNRDPLPLNINPQLTFHDDPIQSKNDQVRISAISWFACTHASVLPPCTFLDRTRQNGMRRILSLVLL